MCLSHTTLMNESCHTDISNLREKSSKNQHISSEQLAVLQQRLQHSQHEIDLLQQRLHTSGVLQCVVVCCTVLLCVAVYYCVF